MSNKIDNLNTTIKALKSSKFYSVNGHGIVSFRSDVQFVANRNSTCFMNGNISSPDSINFVKELNEAILPVLDKYLELAKIKLKQEVGKL